MNYRRLGSLALGGATLAWLAVGAAPLAAQNTAVITGRVVSERGDPLGGATVIVNNTNFGATTAPNGTYTITITSAAARGQTLAQMALAWVLRNGGITSALIGASKPEQVVDCVGALDKLDFTPEELAQIDAISEEKDINLWARSSED